MPLVTQLSEGVQPLVFPTDLSINAMDKQHIGVAGEAALERKSPAPSIKREIIAASSCGSETNCPSKAAGSHQVVSSNADESADKSASRKLNDLSEEEVTSLMLKAAAEKVGTANSSGNMSDTSYSEDNNTSAGVPDFPTGLCNINILSSISAMNSLIGVSGIGSSGGVGSGGGGIGGSSSGSGSGGGGSVSMGGSGGHPCPECGRVYKLKSSLRNHQKWECGKEPQFQCPFCVYRAKQKMHIGRHMERMHKEKFIKLEDLKSFANAGAGASNVSGVSASDDSTVVELRQHFP